MNTQTATPSKETILAALSAFARQRPGLDFSNYGDCKSYNAEMRSITKTLADFHILRRSVELSDGITAEMLMEASRRAFSGRLSFTVRDNGAVAVDYCAGQYWPTEYRNAACSVLASALWNHRRASMPAPTYKQYGSAENLPMRTEEGYGPKHISAGEWIRRSFRREFGRGIASRWFN